MLLLLGALGAGALAAPGGADAPRLAHVTLLGDSVPTAVSGDPQALGILAQGIDLSFLAAVCRTIAGVSCPEGDSRPPTVLDEVQSRGAALGSTVIVVAGYNEPAASFAGDLDQALTAMEAA